MAVKQNTTVQSNFSTVTPRVIDFVTRFENNWQGLRDVIGISNPIRKRAGENVYVKKATVTLANGAVAEGDEIPYSQASVTQTALGTIAIEKYAKGVSLEAINTYGYDVAIERTDNEFLSELTEIVWNKFFTFMNGDESAITASKATFQAALANAKGQVENKFKGMHKGIDGVVAFVNYLDFYDYLGGAAITVQNQFGMNYVEDFMGYRAVFLCADAEVASGTIFATPVNNLIMYYIDPADADFARAGLEYTTSQAEVNLIGVHVEGKYTHAVSDMFAILGMTVLAEYADGIAKLTIGA